MMLIVVSSVRAPQTLHLLGHKYSFIVDYYDKSGRIATGALTAGEEGSVTVHKFIPSDPVQYSTSNFMRY